MIAPLSVQKCLSNPRYKDISRYVQNKMDEGNSIEEVIQLMEAKIINDMQAVRTSIGLEKIDLTESYKVDNTPVPQWDMTKMSIDEEMAKRQEWDEIENRDRLEYQIVKSVDDGIYDLTDETQRNQIKEVIEENNIRRNVKDVAAVIEELRSTENLGTRHRRKRSKVFDKIMDTRFLRKKAYDISLNTLKRDFGVVQDENGDYRIDNNNIGAVRNYLMNEMIKRDLDHDTLMSIMTITEENGFDMVVKSTQMENMLMKIVDTNVVRRRKTGINGVLTPSVMRPNVQVESSYTDANGKVYKSSTEFYDVDKTQIKGIGIWLPNSFRELVGMGDVIDLNTIDQRLLEGIGYRIPTQNLAMMEFFRIEGFLPEAAGDMAIVPEGVIAKTNADFDWDKLFAHLPNYRIDENGMPQYLEFTEDENVIWDRRKQEFALKYAREEYLNVLREYKKRLERAFGQKDVEIKSFIDTISNTLPYLDSRSKVKQVLREVNREISLLWNEGEYELSKKMTMNRKQFQNKVNGISNVIQQLRDSKEKELEKIYAKVKPRFDQIEDIYEKNGIEVVDNMHLSKQRELLSMPERFGFFIAPVTVNSGASALRDNIDALVNKNTPELEMRSNEGLSSMVRLSKMNKVGSELVQSTLNVGSSANNIVWMIKSQNINEVAQGRATILPHNVYNGNTIYGRMMTVEGYDRHYIGNIMDEITSGYLDAGNENFMAKANLVGVNASMFVYLVRIGTPVEVALNFINQPALLRYVALKNRYESQQMRMNRAKDEVEDYHPDNFIEMLKVKAGIGDDLKLKMRMKMVNTDRMAELANANYNVMDETNSDFVNNMPQADARMQFVLLREYQKLQSAVEAYTDMHKATTLHNKGFGKNLIDNKAMIVESDQYIDPGDQLDEHLQGIIYNTIRESVDILRQFHMYTKHKESEDAVDFIISKVMERKDIGTRKKQKILNKIRDIYTYYYHKHKYNTGYTRGTILAATHDSRNSSNVIRQLRDLQQRMEMGNIPYIKLLDDMEFRTNVEFGLYKWENGSTTDNVIYLDSVTLKRRGARSLDTGLMTEYKSDFRTLTNYIPEEKLFMMIMNQHGLRTGITNLIDIVPYDIYARQMEEPLINAQLNKDVKLEFGETGFWMMHSEAPTFSNDRNSEYWAVKHWVKGEAFLQIGQYVIPERNAMNFKDYQRFTSAGLYTDIALDMVNASIKDGRGRQVMTIKEFRSWKDKQLDRVEKKEGEQDRMDYDEETGTERNTTAENIKTKKVKIISPLQQGTRTERYYDESGNPINPEESGDNLGKDPRIGCNG